MSSELKKKNHCVWEEEDIQVSRGRNNFGTRSLYI